MIKNCCFMFLITIALSTICLFSIFAAVLFTELSPATACQQSVQSFPRPGIHARVMDSSGFKRCYLLYLPKDYDPSKPVPVVISFHGFASTPAGHAAVTRWNTIADSENFIVVYPQGTGFPLRWNSFTSAGWSAVDDVAFTRDLIVNLETNFAVDKSRIYVTGFSNGGAMTYNLACELSDIIAAVGIISAPVVEPPSGCHPSRPVPIMAFHGTDDLIVNYNGAKFDLPFWYTQNRTQRNSFSYLPTREWIERWSQRNLCDPVPENLPLNGNVNGIRFTDCANQAEVIFYSIESGGHTWPGGKPLVGLLVGETSTNIDASAEIWSFFQQHPLSNN
jgi:polyhydroxybutyrate depolymerase